MTRASRHRIRVHLVAEERLKRLYGQGVPALVFASVIVQNI